MPGACFLSFILEISWGFRIHGSSSRETESWYWIVAGRKDKHWLILKFDATNNRRKLMMIVLTNSWKIMTTFCLFLRIMRKLTIAVILTLSVIWKRALNYLPAASIVRDIITDCISFYYASFVKLCLNLFLFCCIYFFRLEVLVYIPFTCIFHYLF